MAAFAIKAAIADADGSRFAFTAQKTMYGGKRIAPGDAIFLFASESGGGEGLIARGVVISAEAHPKPVGSLRYTPRVSVAIDREAVACRPLGRTELKRFVDWNDGRPQTELNFKLYRQATGKIVEISNTTATFLGSFF